MTFFIEIAGQIIQINSIYERVRKQAKHFLVTPQSPDFIIDVNEDDLNSDSYSYDINTEKATIEYMIIHRKIADQMLSNNILLMHGSVIGVGDSAYMITAKSGVGKTTRTNIWLKSINNSYIINGDKPFLRFEGGEVLACGSPWCGKENQGNNVMVPLKAIYFLERSEENEVIEVNYTEAFPLLLQQTYVPKDSAKVVNVIKLLKSLDGKVKFFKFYSNLEEEAVLLAYKAGNYDEH